MKVFGGIILIAIGICIIAFSSTLTDTVGRWPWADRYLGGTTKGFITIGFVTIIFAFIIIFGGRNVVSMEVPQGFTNTNTIVK